MNLSEPYILLGVAVFVLIVWNIILNLKLNKLNNRFNNSISGYSDDFNLEQTLSQTVSEVSAFRTKLDKNVSDCGNMNSATNEKVNKHIEEINSKIDKQLLDAKLKLDDTIEEINSKVDLENTNIREMIESINNNLEICIQKTALVRYNPFKNVGGELCFALALLDNKNNGYMLNTIFTENGCYTYCKQIEDGKSSITLSEEEEQAIELAKNKKIS